MDSNGISHISANWDNFTMQPSIRQHVRIFIQDIRHCQNCRTRLIVDGTFSRERDNSLRNEGETNEIDDVENEGDASDVGSDAPLTRVDSHMHGMPPISGKLPQISLVDFRTMSLPPDKIIISIDRIVYDVTDLAAMHPGGVDALRRRRGTDASEAFESVGHSDTARSKMAQYAIYYLQDARDKETLDDRHVRMEVRRNEEEMAEILRSPYVFGRCSLSPSSLGSGKGLNGILEISLFQGVGIAMLGAFFLTIIWIILILRHPVQGGDDHGERGAYNNMAEKLHLPEWNFCLVLGWILSKSNFGHSIFIGNIPRISPILSPHSHMLALISLALVICSSSIAINSRDEGGRDQSQGERPPQAATLIAAGFMLCPFADAIAGKALITTRGVSALLLSYTSFILVDPFLVNSLITSNLAHRPMWLALLSHIQLFVLSKDKSSTPPLHLASAYLSSMLALVGCPLMKSPFGGNWYLPWTMHQFWWAFGSAVFLIHVFSSSPVRRTSRECMSEMRSLVCAMSALMIAHGRNEIGDWMLWACLALIVNHGCNLYWIGRLKLKDVMTEDELEYRAWIWGVLQFVDMMRYAVALILFRPIKLALYLVNQIMPHPLTYYAYGEAVAHYGKNVEMGVAYRVLPPSSLKKKPMSFVCNIGHLGSEHDWRLVGQSTLAMIKSLNTKEAAEAGFVGQYLAQFPSRQEGIQGRGWTQLNLTAWTDEEAAHNWYVNNEEHVKIVQQYRSGSLRSFSSMLARLSTTKDKVAWQPRCRTCAAIVAGYPEQQFCKVCGERTWNMSLI